MSADISLERSKQILTAAMVCFARRGFHQSTMHDISAEAGISVGLIYRYFENKDAVISAMAEEHKREVQEVLERARQAPTLLDALEVVFTSFCCENAPQVQSAFVVDLFAEASRNPRVAELVRGVVETTLDGLADLIERAPEARDRTHGLSPREIASLLFAINDGLLLRDVIDVTRSADSERRERQLHALRSVWRLLFRESPAPIASADHSSFNS
jgi:TetR/AcrR family transcriptional regulator, repressor for uid operon